MSNYATVALASLRGITAFYALLACVILAPAAITLALLSHLLSRDDHGSDEEDDEQEHRHDHGDVAHQRPPHDQPRPLAQELLHKIPLLKFTHQNASSAGTSAAAETRMTGTAAALLPMSTVPACDGCVVCLVPFQEQEEVRVLPLCHHSFHQPCIDRWFQTHSTCPICRRRLSSDCFREADTASHEAPWIGATALTDIPDGAAAHVKPQSLPLAASMAAMSSTGNCIIEIDNQ